MKFSSINCILYLYRFQVSELLHWRLQVILNGWSATGIKEAVEKGQGNLEPLDPLNAIHPDAFSVINTESLALLSIENLNTGDDSSSDEDDDNDGDVYEAPVDENRSFSNIFDSFVDEDDDI